MYHLQYLPFHLTVLFSSFDQRGTCLIVVGLFVWLCVSLYSEYKLYTQTHKLYTRTHIYFLLFFFEAILFVSGKGFGAILGIVFNFSSSAFSSSNFRGGGRNRISQCAIYGLETNLASLNFACLCLCMFFLFFGIVEKIITHFCHLSYF